MATTDPATHHLDSNGQTSTNGNYGADLAKMKEDLANLLKTQLGVSTGRSCIYE